ncbi:PAQR family membrane homeostasis protein TrhA [Croceiramulus getboli]|nr:hemolysin III family protein [Flavobacteriaceae bacterium YJPT1-3]
MYSKKEELLNAISHGIGIPLALIGLILLLVYNTQESALSTFAILVYGASMLLLYAASTLYHATTEERKKFRLRKLDHISIYFLIAGTYTPVVLISLVEGEGWTIFGIVWGLTALGTLLKVFFTGKFELLSVLLYLVMGWIIVFYLDPLKAAHPEDELLWLFLGGLFYSLGIIFYLLKNVRYAHFIWHLFVLAGSICHFLFILIEVI